MTLNLPHDFSRDFTDQPIFLLIAPTGAGKTELAIQLAQKYHFEIINADAYQFFTMMDIGTAKPTQEERSKVPHHLFDICQPDQPYSAHQFASAAKQTACDIFARGKYPLLVGGSGFYARAFLTRASDLPKGTMDFDDDAQAYRDIVKKDPALGDTLHPNDTYRISRAGFLLSQGLIPSQAWQQELEQKITNPFHVLTITMDREILYQRINRRAEVMIEQGLLAETDSILKSYPKARERLQKTIGYQQVLAHQSGSISYADMLAQIQQKTRNYAKRQMTWIRNQLRPKEAHFEYAFDEISCYIDTLTL